MGFYYLYFFILTNQSAVDTFFVPLFSVVKSPVFDTLSTAKRKKNYRSFIIIMSDNLWSSLLFIIFGFKK